MRYTIYVSKEFLDWLKNLPIKEQVIVNSRLERIKIDGHWGTVNRFDIFIELKWKSGLRIYTTLCNNSVYILLGGNKNGQNKDIRKAKKIYAKWLRKI